jgi:DNA (cytosine-5)-methyltransferase 1
LGRQKRPKIPAISVFTGSGGMDIGFLREGFDIRVAVEIDPAACATLRKNFRTLSSRIIQRPLEDVTTEELLEAAQLEVGEAGCVLGGPPCQSWSVAGNRLGLKDPRGRGVAEFLRVVREARPLTFCMENVPGLLSHSDAGGLRIFRDALNADGGTTYELTSDVMNAAEFGAPQQRKRVFIIGWRGPGEFTFPSPTHQVATTPHRSWRQPAATVGQAFSGLPKAEPPGAIAQSVAKSIPKRNAQWYGRR